MLGVLNKYKGGVVHFREIKFDLSNMQYLPHHHFFAFKF